MEGKYGTHQLKKYTTLPLLLSYAVLKLKPTSLITYSELKISTFDRNIFAKYPVVWKFAENYHKHYIQWEILYMQDIS
jgi:hypothetical protein